MVNRSMAEEMAMAWDLKSRRGKAQLIAALFISVLLIYLYINIDYYAGVHEIVLSKDIKQKSCLSRDASAAYRRKPSPHTPSPYLLSKLKSYESLHHQCGPKTRLYKQSLKSFTSFSSHNTSSSSSCNYIIWTPSQGLGNQMVSLVSAFLYALLTNRVLLVDFGPDQAELFCEPFLGSYSSWILPGDFPHKGNFQHLPNLRNHLRKTASDELPSFMYIDLDRFNYFQCDETHKIVNRIPVLYTQSCLYYAPSLFMTPSFTQELAKLFPQKTTVFHHLSRYLFHPSDEAWEHITDYYDTNLAKAQIKIGLQIRVVNSDSVTPRTILNQILTCNKTHHILPPPQNPSNSSTAILIASLYPHYARNLTATYHGPTSSSSSPKTVNVYQPSSDGRQKFYSGRQNMKAWVEMYLLSLCDKLVTTGESTFGYVPEGLSGFKPLVLRKPDGKTAGMVMSGHTGGLCWRAPTIDPCFQYPPRYDCKAKKQVFDVAPLFPGVIKRCEDRAYGYGIRLTD